MSSYIDNIQTAWRGHRDFSQWIVKTMIPTTIVELGVDYGFSAFCFEKALSMYSPNGKIYGIDRFTGDDQTDFRNTKEFVTNIIKEHNLQHIEIIEGDFTEVSKIWKKPIDILHIDGYHTYEAVKNDFECWSSFVRDNGVILFHDTSVEYYGIKKFFTELEGGYKLCFIHSAGLGIYTKNKELYDNIVNQFNNVYPVYNE